MTTMKKAKPTPRAKPSAGPWHNVRSTAVFGHRSVTATFDPTISEAVLAANVRAVRATPELLAAAVALVDSCGQRLPAESTNSVALEAIHVLRLESALRTAGLIDE